MKRFISSFLLLAGLTSAATSSAGEASQIEHGRHLVEDIGLCADCHSPRNDHGEFIPGKRLQGSPLGFAPSVPMPMWASVAPRIAGLVTYNDAEAVTLFTKGVTNHGGSPRPPMPAFRFSEDEAKAVIAYLRTLSAEK
jgi:mono/diheme cytochrome c family protein